MEISRNDLKKTWHILFAEILNHERVAQQLHLPNDSDIVVISHRTKGLLITSTDDLANIRTKDLSVKYLPLNVAMSLWPDKFCSKEEINDWANNPFDKAFSIHPETPWVEQDGVDPNGYPSVAIALHMI